MPEEGYSWVSCRGLKEFHVLIDSRFKGVLSEVWQAQVAATAFSITVEATLSPFWIKGSMGSMGLPE